MNLRTKHALPALAFCLTAALAACSNASSDDVATTTVEETATPLAQSIQATTDDTQDGWTLTLNKGTIDENGQYTNDDLYFSYVAPEGFALADEDVLAQYNEVAGTTGTVRKSGRSVNVEPGGTYADMYCSAIGDADNNISLIAMNITHTDVDLNSASFLTTMAAGFAENLEGLGITSYDISTTTVEAGEMTFPSLLVEYEDGGATRYLQRFYYLANEQWLVNVTAAATSEDTLNLLLTGSAD